MENDKISKLRRKKQLSPTVFLTTQDCNSDYNRAISDIDKILDKIKKNDLDTMQVADKIYSIVEKCVIKKFITSHLNKFRASELQSLLLKHDISIDITEV